MALGSTLVLKTNLYVPYTRPWIKIVVPVLPMCPVLPNDNDNDNDNEKIFIAK